METKERAHEILMSPPEMSRDALQGKHTMWPMIFVSIKVQQTKILTISGFNTLNKIHTYSFNSGAGYFKMQQDQKKLSNWMRGFKFWGVLNLTCFLWSVRDKINSRMMYLVTGSLMKFYCRNRAGTTPSHGTYRQTDFKTISHTIINHSHSS